MKRINLSKEREQELINIYSEFIPAERVQVVSFSNSKEAEDCDDIVLAQGQDNDYRIDYFDKNDEKTHIYLAGMSEIDAEHRFNSMFPGNIFINATKL